MSRLKIGIIGGGGIVNAHLPRLSVHPEVELVALADPNPAAEATAKHYGIPQFFADYHELLPLVDAVLVCVPTFLHAEIAVAALEAGKAVFCEKPLARTLEQATAMQTAAQKSGAPLQVGFVRRFDEEWLLWREAIQSGKIGRPAIWYDVTSNGGPPSPWFHREEQGGGPFLDAAIHNIDFALYTFGPAKWVFCNGRTLRNEGTAIDTGTATIHFESGDELVLAWTWALPIGAKAEHLFEILGPEGTLTWPKGHDSGAEDGYILLDNGNSQEQIAFSNQTLNQGFADQMDEFVQVARREKQPRVGINEGCEALRLALAVLESARSGHVVRLEN